MLLLTVNIDLYLMYVYIYIGWYEDNWFEANLENEKIDCTKEQMRAAAEGHITTEALMWNQNTNQKTISGMVIYIYIYHYCFQMLIIVSKSSGLCLELFFCLIRKTSISETVLDFFRPPPSS